MPVLFFWLHQLRLVGLGERPPDLTGQTFATSTGRTVNMSNAVIESSVRLVPSPAMTSPGAQLASVEVFTTDVVRKSTSNTAQDHARLVLRSGVIKDTAESLFKAHDTNNDGKLSWENYEIKSFIERLHRKYDLPCPSKEQSYNTFQRFDEDKSGHWEWSEAANFVEMFHYQLSLMEKKDETSCCPAGHVIGMLVIKSYTTTYKCSKCQDLSKDDVIWHCNPCKYYLCTKCFQNRSAGCVSTAAAC